MNANTIYNQRAIDRQLVQISSLLHRKQRNIAFDKQRTLQKAEKISDYEYGKYPSTKQSEPTILISTRSKASA